MVSTKGVLNIMKQLSKSEWEELQGSGKLRLKKEEKKVDDIAHREMLREFIKNMSSIEDSLSTIEDSLLQEIGEVLKKVAGKKLNVEFTVERDSRGFMKKIIAQER